MNGSFDLRDGLFSYFTLKVIACVVMAIDHVGAYLFPGELWLRIIGRIAFPIFAYFIAEGCIYTRNKKKRLFTIALVGVICEIIYFIYAGSLYGNIMLTFTLSVIMIYCMQWVKSVLKQKKLLSSVGACGIFVIAMAAVYKMSGFLGVDYGFYGVMFPVAVAFFDGKNQKKLRFAAFCVWLVFFVSRYGFSHIQAYSLLSIPFIALYNGKPGVKKLKYAFYLFYPLHLVAIWLIGLIMQSV